ncbi:hypothetical protein TRICHSKD4_0550 [Roseibium sp. TrichSKD4]|uniref:hypothetical protein n=1 Tax=Roseibium sp. TrichSKD4 TaxID=744980 RepID=UPI0001E5653F|nr:hypothetical protein [Roseibium sp. TrichSKD4]EFO34061.1 hypothetical protein TRICHSKD4_0550 [Roseibium sp. TrichSKD4]
MLGGDIPRPRQILNLVRLGDYRGYAEADINEADNRSEPKRSAELRKFQKKFTADLKRDLAIYRKVVRKLREEREQNPPREPLQRCEDIHTAMSLKFSHLVNDFAHLVYLDELLTRQGDLFDF